MIKEPFKTTPIVVSKEIKDALKIMAVHQNTTIQRIADRIFDAYLTKEKEKEKADGQKN